MDRDAPGYREPPDAGNLVEACANIMRVLGPRVSKVAVQTVDAGWHIAIAIERSRDGRRHAVQVCASPTWEREAIDQLLEWLDHGKGAR